MKAPNESTLTLETVAGHFAQWRSGKNKAHIQSEVTFRFVSHRPIQMG